MAKTTPALTLSDFAEEVKRPGSKCWFEVLLTEEQRQIVNAAHESGSTHAQISRTLQKKLNLSVKQTAVGNHYRGGCCCGASK